MTVTRSVAEILSERVMLESESIDRLYLNLHQPRLMYRVGSPFSRTHQGATFASSAMMAPLPRAFQAVATTFIQRIATTGGPAPAECNATTAGTVAEVPYTRGLLLLEAER
jgi:hypothetical protein